MILPISLTIAAALAILNVVVAFRVSRLRLRGRAEGDAGVDTRMRTHANLVEYAPFFLVLLALVELSGASPFWLWAAGAAFVAARLSHAVGMDRPSPNPFRAGGALATWALLLVLAGWALAVAYAARVPAAPALADPSSIRA